MKFNLLLVSLSFAAASAMALTPESFKRQTQTLELKALNIDENKICESLGYESVQVAGMDQMPFYPIAANWVQTRSNQFLAFGSCFKNDAEVKVLTRFYPDAIRDLNFEPVVLKNDLYPKFSCREKSFVESPAGEFFITLNCDLPDTYRTQLVQKIVVKLKADGTLDSSFAQNGKLVADAVATTVTPDPLGFLPDGTIVDQSCTRGYSPTCSIYNVSAKTGAVLGQKTIEYHPSVHTPFHFEDLNEGILREETLPICSGFDCLYTPIWGVSTGLASFQDILNRQPMIDPHPVNNINFTPFYYRDGILAPFWRPQSGQPEEKIDSLKFDLINNRYNLVYETEGPVRRVTVVDGFSPQIPFTEPIEGVVQRIDFELDLNVKQSESVQPLDPNNRMECESTAKFGDGILVTCHEITPWSKIVGLVYVAFDRNMRINQKFADHGYLRPEGLADVCFEERFTKFQVTDRYLQLECDKTSFNGDFSVNFEKNIYLFQ